jgi:hypothetical protein
VAGSFNLDLGFANRLGPLGGFSLVALGQGFGCAGGGFKADGRELFDDVFVSGRSVQRLLSLAITSAGVPAGANIAK